MPRPPDQRPEPRLYLVTPLTADPHALAAALAPALAAEDVGALLLRLPQAETSTLLGQIAVIAPAVQKLGTALILDGYADLVAGSGADGAHLTGAAAFMQAVDSLKPDRIAGVGGLHTRHEAMLAAERGADYVMFGEPDDFGHRPAFDAILERVEWWAEVFQTPCVGYAESLREAEALARAGADFIAVGGLVFDDAKGLTAAVAEATACIRVAEPAT